MFDVDAIRTVVRAQADAAGPRGWLDIPVPGQVRAGGVLRVPRGAFERWCAWRSGGAHLTAPWSRVSPQGVKQLGDDAYHTDWMLGAGLDPTDMASSGPNPHRQALWHAVEDARDMVEARLLRHGASVLLGGPCVDGTAWHPRGHDDRPHSRGPVVAVLADARPDWLGVVDAVLAEGGAVVVERGGETAHLIAVLRGHDRGPMLRVPGARRLFPEGTPVRVAADEARVTLRDDGRTPEAGPVRPEFVAPVPVTAPVASPEVPPDGFQVPGTDVRCVPLTDRLRDFRDSLPFQLEVGSRADGPRWGAHGILHAASLHAETQALFVHLMPNGAAYGSSGPRPRYYAGTRDWISRGDGAHLRRLVTEAVLDLHDPRPSIDEVMAAERARARAALDGYRKMSDAALLAATEEAVSEGEWLRDHAEEFSAAEVCETLSLHDLGRRQVAEVARERGIAVPGRDDGETEPEASSPTP